jgi:hypothetical protein
VVVIAMVAAFTCFFQIVAAFLCLAAVFTVFALSVMQLKFRIADSLFALSVTVMVMVKCLRGDGPSQEPGKDQCRNQRFAFLQHVSSSACALNLTLGCILSVWHPNKQNKRVAHKIIFAPGPWVTMKAAQASPSVP